MKAYLMARKGWTPVWFILLRDGRVLVHWTELKVKEFLSREKARQVWDGLTLRGYRRVA